MSVRGSSTENRRRQWAKKPWGRLYRARMRAGLEYCRACSEPEGFGELLTMDHIVPVADGGASTLENLTILCTWCNAYKGSETWDLTSLAAEEAAAKPEHRWSALLYADLRTRRHTCAECGREVGSDCECRLQTHPDVMGAAACPGSRSRVPDSSVAALLALGEAARPGRVDRPLLMPRPRDAGVSLQYRLSDRIVLPPHHIVAGRLGRS